MTSQTTLNGRIEHRIGETGSLSIKLAAAELRLVATDGDHVVIQPANGGELPSRLIVEAHDGSLALREHEGFGLTIGRGRRTVELVVEVPAAAAVAIDTASGWIDARGLVGPQSIRTASSDVSLNESSGRIDLTVVSGDSTIELVDAADLAVRTVSGDVRVRGGRLDRLRVQSTSGDIRIESPLVGAGPNSVETLSGDVALVAGPGLRVEARTVSGDLSSELPHQSDGRMGRRSLVVGDGSIELAFRSMSGDLRILRAPPADRPPTPPRPEPPPSAPPAPDPSFGSGSPRAVVDRAADRGDDRDGLEARRMTILRALEVGELDVAAAMHQLAALDDAEPAADAE